MLLQVRSNDISGAQQTQHGQHHRKSFRNGFHRISPRESTPPTCPIYYISDLPSDLVWSDVVVIAAVSFGLSLLATLYPSYRASRINPAAALRYE
jgi:ABC-type lipoprotein release transport system permease subunit